MAIGAKKLAAFAGFPSKTTRAGGARFADDAAGLAREHVKTGGASDVVKLRYQKTRAEAKGMSHDEVAKAIDAEHAHLRELRAAGRGHLQVDGARLAALRDHAAEAATTGAPAARFSKADVAKARASYAARMATTNPAPPKPSASAATRRVEPEPKSVAFSNESRVRRGYERYAAMRALADQKKAQRGAVQTGEHGGRYITLKSGRKFYVGANG